jgi:hypothetical protein
VIRYTGSAQEWYTCFAAATGSRPNSAEFSSFSWYDGKGTRLIVKLAPTTIPDKGEAGIVFYDWVNQHALLFGLRNAGGVYELITEAFFSGVSQGVTVQHVSALATHWLHLGPTADVAALPTDEVHFTAAWSTTSEIAGYSSSAPITAKKAFQYAGMYVRSTDALGAGLAGALDVSFDDAILRNPFGTRSDRWYVFRDPTLPGSPDLPGARSTMKRLKQAHTDGTVITSKSFFCDSAISTCDGGPLGAV